MTTAPTRDELSEVLQHAGDAITESVKDVSEAALKHTHRAGQKAAKALSSAAEDLTARVPGTKAKKARHRKSKILLAVLALGGIGFGVRKFLGRSSSDGDSTVTPGEDA